MSTACSDEEFDSLLPASRTIRSAHRSRIIETAAATAGLIVLAVLLVTASAAVRRGGGNFLQLDGGCGPTCGEHSAEVLEPADWVALLRKDRSVNNASLLEAYLHAAFDLTYNCSNPLRLPGPIIPGTIADGGYVVCDEPEVNWHANECTLFSFGIASDDTFEAAVAHRYGCEVHEFDPTVAGSWGALDENISVTFHREGCWSHKTNLSIGPVDSIENLVREYRDKNKSLNLKIDVEGAEWDTLPAIPDWLFDQVDHLILEIHTTLAPPSPYHQFPVFFEPPTLKMVESLVRVREKFYLFHWHVNNCCPPTPLGTDYAVPVWNVSGYTDAEIAVAAPGSTPIGHDFVVPVIYPYSPYPVGIPRGPAPNLPDSHTAVPPGLSVPGPIELSFLRKSLVPFVPKGPFDLHEEMNGPNTFNGPMIDSQALGLYGWNHTFDQNWARYRREDVRDVLDRTEADLEGAANGNT